jgi:hypothetical protein
VTDTAAEDNRAAQLIAAAGLHPDPEELALFTMMYPFLRAKADTVHQLNLGFEA